MRGTRSRTVRSAHADSTCGCDGSTRRASRSPVEDSGIGISAESLSRLFEFGFTTKNDGHGFGLHTCAILAKELSGDLRAFSDGENRGARFELEFAAPAIEVRKLA